MSACDAYRVRILSYLDDRLKGAELDEFLTHLEDCSNCQASVETERSLSQVLCRSRPLYSAPSALRARVAATVKQHTTAHAQKSFNERVKRLLGSRFADPARRVARLRFLAASLAFMAMLLAFVPHFVRQARAADYVETAMATHRSYLDGHLPVGLQSNSPEQVCAWFSGKVEFTFRLPKAQITPNSTPAYQLTGGSLVKYRGKPAAVVTYQKQNEKISLIVASADSAVVAGGEEVRSGKLTFHYRTEEGFNVVTWTTHGQSYALVSSLSGPARESCMVCHQSMADLHNLN